MNNFIDPEYASQFITSAFSGFAVVMLLSVVNAFIIMKTLTGRRITFMIVLWSLFLVFFVSFYGLNYVMRKHWGMEATLGDGGINLVSLGVGVGLTALLGLYWKFAIPEGPTLSEVEEAQLKEEEMTPLDFKRREHMSKYKRK
jgi:hypothetical protein